MFRFLRPVGGWTARRALPVVAVSVVAAAAAGGAVTHALDGRAAAASSTQASRPPTAPTAGHTAAAHRARAAAAETRAFALLAADTGLSIDAIRSQLRSGRSLADIAGPDAARFRSDLLAPVTSSLANAVSSGRMTTAQQTARLAKATELLSKLMSEPGTTLLQQGQRLQQFVHGRAARAPAKAAPAATPSPTP